MLGEDDGGFDRGHGCGAAGRSQREVGQGGARSGLRPGECRDAGLQRHGPADCLGQQPCAQWGQNAGDERLPRYLPPAAKHAVDGAPQRERKSGIGESSWMRIWMSIWTTSCWVNLSMNRVST